MLKRAYQAAMRKHGLNGMLVDAVSLLTFSGDARFLPQSVCYHYCVTKAFNWLGALDRRSDELYDFMVTCIRGISDVVPGGPILIKRLKLRRRLRPL